ncbi:Na+/H+ antiporter NhaA [Roseomonas marmotae]|uniref:Na(+)/H(+) antiporter NhaA n=1 Tax=Roseomonas marmotae TaxID=2768161 RepID=A0ABS3K6C5_9PROT|nr:Na+/H+ antiporter NhaA [Roseomonas marmotae]MBO1072999.1 Na+/H+ antiporter NhaA [Roseomonas marmotae]QTI79353.1 Na+/H+ antiporter NhaA [Roseomonas marmotae]
MTVPGREESRRPFSMLRAFLDNSASGGLVLMAAAALALIIANSPLAPSYFAALHAYLGPLSVQHWINDALMAVFFLLVGLEIKREVLDGQLASWSRRILPGVAAAGGMLVPALIFSAFNWNDPQTLRGWAIPAATDIAFALGVLALLGSRVPTSLKIFLTALAIIDDLGAVVIIALFYSGDLSLLHLGLAAAVVVALVAMNRMGVVRLLPYLLLGVALWYCVLRSGVHATIAGVLLAFTIPLHPRPARPDDMLGSPLHRLEHGLHGWVSFLIIPIFGFANAGVSFAGLTPAALVDHLTLGVALGLLAGKVIGVFGSAALMIRLGLADVPMGATRTQIFGVSLLCGIGFTMSLFIGMLAFSNDPLLQDEVKIGILCGSILSGLAGWAVLRVAPREIPAPEPRVAE